MFTSPSAVPPTAGVVVAANYPLMNSTSTTSTNPSWRSTTNPPTVVSILNGNSPPIYIATQPLTTTTTTANLLRPSSSSSSTSSQTVRLVSPALTLINNSNTLLTGQIPAFSTPINHLQSGTCIDTSVLGGRLETGNHQDEQQVKQRLWNNDIIISLLGLFIKSRSKFSRSRNRIICK